MRVLLQRVSRGSVTVADEIVGEIGQGYVLLLGVGAEDGQGEVQKLVKKIVGLRIFSDAEGKFNHSLLDVEGEALVVSQFTLYADARKGRRPSFSNAAPPQTAQSLVDFFVEELKRQGVKKVASGVFGASMRVEICNEGPVTIWLDSDELAR